MRAFLRRFRWPLLIAAAFLALVGVVVLSSLATNVFRGPDADPWPPPVTPTSRLEAYQGVGSWVDVYDKKAWIDPAATVADLASHGVTTLYLETATPHSSSGAPNPSALAAFIDQAHARHMFVVAWYPPNMRAGSADLDRIMQAVAFKTPAGGGFDSVALDIESTDVKPVSERNRNIAALSAKLRSRVGAAYPLGAIIPSPVGLKKQTGFWNVFPYAALAKSYDVFVPMGYYTFHTRTAAGAYADAKTNMRLLRAQPGCAKIPVHLIGGLAAPSTASQVREFARACRESGCIGTSIYDWAGMTDARWRAQAAGWGDGTK